MALQQTPAQVEEFDYVKVRNEGDTLFEDSWSNRNFTIQPGQEIVVPLGAALNWVGDWSSRNWSPRNMARRREYEQVKVRYGIYDHNPDEESHLFPKLAVFSMSGERRVTVLEDPHGQSLAPAEGADFERNAMLQRMAKLQSEMQALSDAVAMTNPDADEDLLIPQDTGSPEKSDVDAKVRLPRKKMTEAE